MATCLPFRWCHSDKFWHLSKHTNMSGSFGHVYSSVTVSWHPFSILSCSLLCVSTMFRKTLLSVLCFEHSGLGVWILTHWSRSGSVFVLTFMYTICLSCVFVVSVGAHGLCWIAMCFVWAHGLFVCPLQICACLYTCTLIWHKKTCTFPFGINYAFDCWLQCTLFFDDLAP